MKIQIFGMVLLLLLVIFRNTLETLFGLFGSVLSLFPFFISPLCLALMICYRGQVKKSQVFTFLFFSYCIFNIFSFPLVGITNGLLTPFFGFFQLCLPACLAIVAMELLEDRGGRDWFLMFLMAIAVINALGALIQYFIDPSLFGLISNTVYDGVIARGENVGKRAVSFFASPQSLAILMGFSISLVAISSLSAIAKALLIFLLVLAGVLTGSKAFLVYVLTYIALTLNVRYIILLIVTVAVVLIIGSEFEVVGRIFDLKEKISDIGGYPTFLIWQEFLSYPGSTLQFFIGKGFGVISTSSQTIYDYKFLNGSAESFLIQVFFEIGFIGLLLFLLHYLYPIYILIKNNKTRHIGLALLAVTSNMAFTPAFYGFSVSTFVYLVLFYGLVICNKSSETKKNTIEMND